MAGTTPAWEHSAGSRQTAHHSSCRVSTIEEGRYAPCQWSIDRRLAPYKVCGMSCEGMTLVGVLTIPLWLPGASSHLPQGSFKVSLRRDASHGSSRQTGQRAVNAALIHRQAVLPAGCPWLMLSCQALLGIMGLTAPNPVMRKRRKRRKVATHLFFGAGSTSVAAGRRCQAARGGGGLDTGSGAAKEETAGPKKWRGLSWDGQDHSSCDTIESMVTPSALASSHRI